MTVGSANRVAPSNSGSRRSPTTSRRGPTRASSRTSSMSSWPPSSRSPRCYSLPRTSSTLLGWGEGGEGDVAVPAGERAALEVVQAQAGLQLAVVVLDPPSDLGQAHELFDGGVLGEGGQPVAGGLIGFGG